MSDGRAVRDLLVGVDVGTSTIKAGVYDFDLNYLGSASNSTPWKTVDSGAEIDPQELWQETATTILAALPDEGSCRVRALGVTSIAETGFLVRDGRPLAPGIAWFDVRGSEQARDLGASLGDQFVATTGLPISELASVTKLRMLLEEGINPTRAGWYSVAEWIVLGFGGSPPTDASLASRTGLLDLHGLSEYEAATSWAGFPDLLLRDVTASGHHAGYVTRGPVEIRGAAITVAGMDHLCAAYGVDSATAGNLFDSCGTAEALVLAVEAPVSTSVVKTAVEQGLTVGHHVNPQTLAVLGALPCGLVLQSVADLLGQDSATIGAKWPGTPEHDLGISWLPDGTLAIDNIRPGATPEDLWSSALIAVHDRAAELIGLLGNIHAPVDMITAAGGWTRNASFREFRSRMIPHTRWAEVVEPGTLGAARMARELVR